MASGSRFREFLWPRLDDVAMTRRAAQQGLIAAAFVALSAALTPDTPRVFQDMIPQASYVAAAIWAGLALGIHRMSRLAAAAALVLFVLERGLALQETERWLGFALALLFALFFVNTVRATMRFHELGGSTATASDDGG